MLTTILLAAGMSSRFGSPKALARLGETTILERLQQMLLSVDLAEIIVVLGHSQDRLKPYLLNHNKIKVVYNKDYKLGQTSSFQCGLSLSLPGTKGIFLLPVDYPLLQAGTMQKLIGAFHKDQRIIVPTYDGRKGHPPLFPASLRQQLLSLDPQAGLNSIIHQHKKETRLVPCSDPGVRMTFNTPEEFDQIRSAAGLGI